VHDRTVIVVDDGLATGVTARAAVEALRRRGPRRLVLAAPVCAAQTAKLLSSAVDELVCLETPPDLGAIGFWYRDFSQVPDEKVMELLERARQELESGATDPDRRTG
jgi:putative phosphoribosyl transferase